MARQSEIQVIINAKDNAGAALSSVGKSVKSLGDEIEKTNSSLSNTTKILGNVLKGFGTVAVVFSGLALGTGLAASRVEELRLALSAVTKAANLPQVGIDNFVTSLRSLGIEESKALATTSLFIQSQLKLTDALKLARVAQDLAIFSKQDSSEALISLTEAIASQSVMALRNFNIVTTLPKIYKAYADSVGKTTEELTENEKQQAFMNRVLQQGAGVVGTYELAMKSASKQLRSFTNRELVEFKTAVGNIFEPAVLILVESMRKMATQATVAAKVVSSFTDTLGSFVPVVGAIVIAIGAAVVALMGLNLMLPLLGANIISLSTIIGALGFLFMNPLGIAIMAVVAILGFFAVKAIKAVSAANKLPKPLKEIGDVAKGIGKNMKAMGADTVEALRDIDAQIKKTNRSFKEQLAQIIKTHREKVDNLKNQLRQESQDFKDQQADIKEKFDETTGELKTGHEERVSDLQAKLRAENNKLAFADNEKIAKLESRLAKENAKHEAQFLKLQTNRDRDLADAEEKSAQKSQALQKDLDIEIAFLKKHRKEVVAIKGVQLLDEIALLKRNHKEQIEEFNKQKVKTIQSAKEQTAGINTELNKIGEGLDLGKAGTEIGKNMAKAFKKEFAKEVGAFFETFKENIEFLFSKEGAKFMGGNIGSFLLYGPHGQKEHGGPVEEGRPYTVGERGPELFVPRQSGTIVPNQAGSGGDTFNLSISVGTLIDSDNTRRNFAERLVEDIENIAAMRGKEANLIR